MDYFRTKTFRLIFAINCTVALVIAAVWALQEIPKPDNKETEVFAVIHPTEELQANMQMYIFTRIDEAMRVAEYTSTPLIDFFPDADDFTKSIINRIDKTAKPSEMLDLVSNEIARYQKAVKIRVLPPPNILVGKEYDLAVGVTYDVALINDWASIAPTPGLASEFEIEIYAGDYSLSKPLSIERTLISGKEEIFRWRFSAPNSAPSPMHLNVTQLIRFGERTVPIGTGEEVNFVVRGTPASTLTEWLTENVGPISTATDYAKFAAIIFGLIASLYAAVKLFFIFADKFKGLFKERFRGMLQRLVWAQQRAFSRRKMPPVKNKEEKPSPWVQDTHSDGE
ncbi:hypothetical protein HEP89_23085 [Labrenzia sp. 5N]|uniref:hypothetical protein n=1 Tax=Labrenzia sp. 5N TaxID=2723402 RepID=UPI0014476E5C|nr:hypothetical protein [Labrenzia sp. 5N]NKX67011.1 hypothetical protein [Labrenzia sp. 5N]